MRIRDIVGPRAVQPERFLKEYQQRQLTPAEFVQRELGITPEQYQQLKQNIGHIESRGRYNITGGAGGRYTGKYQLGRAATIDAAQELGLARIPTRQELLADPDLQERMQDALMARNVKYIAYNPKQPQASEKFRSLDPAGRAAIVSMAHSAGAGGARSYLMRGQESMDAFRTTGEPYRQAAMAAVGGTTEPTPTSTASSGTGTTIRSGTGAPVKTAATGDPGAIVAPKQPITVAATTKPKQAPVILDVGDTPEVIAKKMGLS
jgi:hypothetical protein